MTFNNTVSNIENTAWSVRVGNHIVFLFKFSWCLAQSLLLDLSLQKDI